MAEAVWYGFIAAMTFIGFVSLVYLLVLYIYRPRGCGHSVLIISADAKSEEISSLIYGAHVRNLIFGGLVSDDVAVLDAGMDDERRKLVLELSKEYGGVRLVTPQQLCESAERKDENGR